MRTSPQPAPASGKAPFGPSDIRNLSTVIHILGGLEKAVNVLETTTTSHTEKIEQLTQWVSAIPYIEKAVEKNSKDLNELGRRHDNAINELKNVSHTVRTLGVIALSGIGVLVFVYIYHHFVAPYFK
jgi:hypothetical protein